MLSFDTDIIATCTKCKRTREMPDNDQPRWPVSSEKTLVVNTDDPCPQCGGTRVKLAVGFVQTDGIQEEDFEEEEG